LHVSPSEAVGDHFQVDETVRKVDATDLAVVAVDVHDLDADELAEHFISERLPGPCPERLGFLRSIDAV
jgi:hypothetical protein